MKNKILGIWVMFVCQMTFGQGNLQFSQVLTISNTDQTVPAGKVWKIESYQQHTVGIGATISMGCTSLSNSRPYYIDGYYFCDIKGTGTGASNILYIAQNSFPIWLKAGQTCRTSCPGDFLSVLEFNIVP